MEMYILLKRKIHRVSNSRGVVCQYLDMSTKLRSMKMNIY